MSNFLKTCVCCGVAVATLAVPVGVFGQDAPVGFVTVVGGNGAERVTPDGATPIVAGAFSIEENELVPGAGVRTLGPDGTAVVVLPGLGVVVSLEPASEIRLETRAASDTTVSLLIRVVVGQVSIVQGTDSSRWIVVEGGSKTAGLAAYTLSKGAALHVQVATDTVSFASRRGQALVYLDHAGAQALIDSSGNPTDASGVTITQGERRSIHLAGPPTVDRGSDEVVPYGLAADVERLALAQSARWLEDAEQGDFTPVRSGARGAPELLSTGFEPALVFDQARPVLTSPTSRPADTAIRANFDPAQALSQSGTPGTVVAGQRFRRSRIVASPGTSATGTLVVNPSSRPTFTLAGVR